MQHLRLAHVRAAAGIEPIELRLRRSAFRQSPLPGGRQPVAEHLLDSNAQSVGEVEQQQQPRTYPALLNLGDKVAGHAGPSGQRLLAQVLPRPQLPQPPPERDESLLVDP